jgi:hypothetical protein
LVTNVDNNEGDNMIFGPDAIFDAIMRLVHLSVAGSADMIAASDAAMQWVLDFNEISVTEYIRKDGHFFIRGTSKSKIIASILQPTAR